MRLLQHSDTEALGEFDVPALSNLERLGLARVAWGEGRELADARLTSMGREYLRENPKLRNPLDVKWIAGVALNAVTLFAVTAVLLKNIL